MNSNPSYSYKTQHEMNPPPAKLKVYLCATLVTFQNIMAHLYESHGMNSLYHRMIVKHYIPLNMKRPTKTE